MIKSPEFNETRDILREVETYIQSLGIMERKAFKVKIEAVSFLIDTYKKKNICSVKVESYISAHSLFSK